MQIICGDGEMVPRQTAQVGRGLAERRRRAASKNICGVGPVTIKKLDRQIELPAHRMSWQRGQQFRQGVGYAYRPSGQRSIDAKNLRRHCDQSRRGFERVVFEFSDRPHRFIIKIEAMCLEKRQHCVHRQPVAFHRIQERCGHRARHRLAVAFALKNFAPPLQPDFSRRRFTRAIPHMRDFDVKSIQCIKRSAIGAGANRVAINRSRSALRTSSAQYETASCMMRP